MKTGAQPGRAEAPVVPVWEGEEEGSGHRVILRYAGSSRTAWATGELDSKEQKKTNKR